MKKDAFEKWLATVPLLGDSEDPLLALVLWLLVGATFLSLFLATSIFTRESVGDARIHVLQTAGGVLVVLGTYTAVRTATMTRSRTASERLISTLALLDSGSEAAQIGAIAHLPTLARQRSADLIPIRNVLDHIAADVAAPACQAAAEQARERLPTLDEERAR
jgi:hypothetical protein